MIAVCCVVAGLDAHGQQPDSKKPQAKAEQAKSNKPDEATARKIAEKTEQLRKAIAALREKKTHNLEEVEIFLKAAENIVRFEEWNHANSVKWTLQTLDQGLERARQAEGGAMPWRDAAGAWAMRAYRSRIDGSVQPYAVLAPQDYRKDPARKWRLDIVLHGRDDGLTEAKFIGSHPPTGKAAKDQDYVQLEVYGRGNNAYRWAGETDVFEAVQSFIEGEKGRINLHQVILRGFSMGGAGAWHIGLHHPFNFAAIGPGAGFSTTRGYVGGMPRQLPDYQEKSLRIYDAVDYAENAFDVPIVAYSGSDDPQKAAADNIEKALAGFKEPLHFTRLIAPGLKHMMPKEWMEKAESEYKKAIAERKEFPVHIRFVTYTTRYAFFEHGWIESLDHLYEKAIVDSHWGKDELRLTTQNVSVIVLGSGERRLPSSIVIDQQPIRLESKDSRILLQRKKNQWAIVKRPELEKELRKKRNDELALQGPIDDAFMEKFHVVLPTRAGISPATGDYLKAAEERFAREWDRYFRGKLPIVPAESGDAAPMANLVLFGDPESNPLIAQVLPKLPITWTRDKLVVNGVEYDPRTHVPVLIYPNPNPRSSDYYVVINSGHTFAEADFKGTNALLYPRLGDWAVIKPTPTAKDPTAHEVVAAGLFDEKWQFQKK
jgi:predicted esterase